jgi:prephenate dehydrogenase
MPELAFRRVAILGTGLIGGSFGLALRRAYPQAAVVGWDRLEIVERARAIGAVSETSSDAIEALRDADLVYLALPIGLTLEILPTIASSVSPDALITDAASTKTVICRVAEKAFREHGRFLGGHPVAGREVSGIENASADLFSGARYALIASEDDNDARVKNFVELVQAIGARPLFFDAQTHDWAAGIISHLPQMVAVALARVVLDETDETGLPASLAGRGLRDATRLAGSPYDVWRDICLTNTDNIARALDRVSQAIDHLRTHLASKDLEAEFGAANELYKILHNLQ